MRVRPNFFENKEMVPKQFKALIRLLIHDMGSINHMKEKQNIKIKINLCRLCSNLR